MQLIDKQLLPHLTKQPLAPIYLICGDIPLLVQESGEMIRNAARQVGYEQRELFFIDNNSDWQKVQQALENFSLFEEKTFLEIRHPKTKFDEAGINLLTTYLRDLPADKRVLLITDKLTAAQQKAPWHQLIDRHGVIVSTRAITMRELPAWIAERMKKAKLQTDPESIQLLAELTEGNLLATQQAIEKLRLLYPDQPIDKKAVAAVVSDNPQFTIFDLTNYILLGAQSRVIRVLQGLRFASTEATLILWAITRELRTLYNFALEKQQGKSLTELLASQWASRQPLLKKALMRLSAEKIATLLQMAEQIDQQIKGLALGSSWQSLETLCLSMAGVDIRNLQ